MAVAKWTSHAKADLKDIAAFILPPLFCHEQTTMRPRQLITDD